MDAPFWFGAIALLQEDVCMRGRAVSSDSTDVCACAFIRMALLLLCACIMRVVVFLFYEAAAPPAKRPRQ